MSRLVVGETCTSWSLVAGLGHGCLIAWSGGGHTLHFVSKEIEDVPVEFLHLVQIGVGFAGGMINWYAPSIVERPPSVDVTSLATRIGTRIVVVVVVDVVAITAAAPRCIVAVGVGIEIVHRPSWLFVKYIAYQVCEESFRGTVLN